ncbi:MAG TPA: PIN domain-containing protein [Thermoanaerobaculia bacterium]|nr:PIN domain-containing protein [Thermoanaerobaculia bacterium]
MRSSEPVFVDTGAWIALALARDPLHTQAREIWETLQGVGARLRTSVPVVLETFTFLDRNIARDVALGWKDSLSEVAGLRILTVRPEDLEEAWPYFRRRNLHKLSAVDATSFVLMTRAKIRTAFAFDHHFAAAGFRLAG